MSSEAPDPLRVLIANERKERVKTTTGLVAAMGHHVIARSLEVSEVAAATAEAMPDVALVGVGESSEHALDLISQIVQEAAYPVIAILETKDAEFVNESGQAGDLRLCDRRRPGGTPGARSTSSCAASPSSTASKARSADARLPSGPRGS